MELIYLWIDGYKNIKNMKCSLNAKYKETSFELDGSKLVLKLNTTNSLNIFGDNLNLKTIIGTNGSVLNIHGGYDFK